MGYYGIIGLQFTKETVMLYDTTIKLHQILNEIFPKLGCGYYSDEEEALLQNTYTRLKEINDRNHVFLFFADQPLEKKKELNTWAYDLD